MQVGRTCTGTNDYFSNPSLCHRKVQPMLILTTTQIVAPGIDTLLTPAFLAKVSYRISPRGIGPLDCPVPVTPADRFDDPRSPEYAANGVFGVSPAKKSFTCPKIFEDSLRPERLQPGQPGDNCSQP